MTITSSALHCNDNAAPLIDDDTVNRARAVPVGTALARLAPGHRLRRTGAELVGACPRCGGRDRFAIHLRKGVWNCRRCEVGGDAIALAMNLTGVGFVEAVAALAGENPPTNPVERFSAKGLPHSGPAAGALHGAPDEAYEAAQRARARAIWQAAVPIAGTPAEAYLASRCLTFHDPDGAVLRFHPRARFFSTETAVMVALYRAIVGNVPRAVQLTSVGAGGWAPGGTRRQTLGASSGAACKLTADAHVAMGLCIGEGVETTIAGMMAGLQPAWAVGSAAAMAKFPVLGGIEALTLFVDNDAGGRRAGSECAARWQVARREVFTVVPATEGHDLADLARDARHGTR